MIRTHGDNCVHPGRRVSLKSAQHLGKGFRLLAPDLACKAEQLLELVNCQADVLAPAKTELLRDHAERHAAPVQELADLANPVKPGLIVGWQLGECHECLGKVPEGSPSRPHRL